MASSTSAIIDTSSTTYDIDLFHSIFTNPSKYFDETYTLLKAATEEEKMAYL